MTLHLRSLLCLLLAACAPVLRAADAPAVPTLWLIGDSTVRNGQGNGAGALWGWGDLLAPHFDTNKLRVVNRALGGRSSRSFLTEGLWDKVLADVKPGDFVMMQFGHNDGGERFKGTRPRASLRGNGEETEEGVVEQTGKTETVHTFGWYLRRYIADAKAKGATPIVCSLIPRNDWKDGTVLRASASHGGWAKQAADAGGTHFIDLNEIIARRYEALGQETVKPFFPQEHTHTSLAGAKLNAECVVEGVRALQGCKLVECLAAPPPPLPRSDANGNPLRRAPTGHVSNYDEAKVGTYTLPDPLVLANGQPVRDADTWLKQRRPEILKLYETHIYGRVPERAPKVMWSVAATDPQAMDGAAVRKHIVGTIGDGPTAPKVNVSLLLPAKATGPVPVLLYLSFFGPPPPTNAAPPVAVKGKAPGFGTPIADFLARGYGYATVRYTEFEGDSRTNNLRLVRAMALAPGQTEPAPDEWGTISAWAWGASRVLDYFETEKSVDAKRVAVIGHSRLGKTALWTGARDPRFAVVFSSCSGEMGASLARRDFGETVDDMAANFPWQFCGNFQKFSGKWNDMPVDAHMVIALNAPRPVFVTGGTQDQWADPHGQFLAQVAAGPVYRLLGKKDLGTTTLPALDTPLTSGELGFHYHTGGHVTTAADWKAFLEFAERHLKPTP